MRFLTILLASAMMSLISSSCSAQSTTPATLTLAREGKSDYTIVLGADAIPAEETAAQQLQNNLQKVTGASFPIKKEGDIAAGAPQILVGASTRARVLLPDQDWSTLGSDGIVIKTVGGNLILAGGRPRGALYAVFEFLEKSVGVRWWTPTESTIPKQSTLRVLAQNTVYTPQIQTREIFYATMRSASAKYDPLFAAQLKINGHFQKGQGEKLGGNNTILGFVHTFSRLLPPEKYFKQHPEWYSDPKNGDKPCTAESEMPDPEKTQLNLTNDEMRAELTKVALEWIAKNPQAGMISISQNDNQNYCRSEGDLKVIEREGSPAGVLLEFVNKVAADIEKEYPDFLVETLAYQYTRKPPRTIKPRKNVVIRLCSIEADFSRPIDSDGNAAFRADVLGWKAITPQLYIWDYVVNFRNFLFPHPNLRVLASNVRFFAANNAISVYEEGDAFSNGVGDFSELKSWLLAHLLWNPQQDEKQLITDFLNGYYGAAGPSLQQYLDIMSDSFEKTGSKLGTFNENHNFLTLDVMNRANTLFADAQKAVADDEVLSQRVRRARLPLDHAWILRYYPLHHQARVSEKKFHGPSDLGAFVNDFISTAQAAGSEQYRLNRPFADYATQLRARFTSVSPPAPLPAAIQNKVLPGNDSRNIIEAQQYEFRLSGASGLSTLVEDALASDKKAARIQGFSKGWPIQYPAYVDSDGDAWRCYLVARIDVKADAPKTGNALDCGLYHANTGKGITQRTRRVAELADGQYHVIDLGAHKLTRDTYFWVATKNNPAVEAIYVDRIIMVRVPKTAQP